MPGEWHARLDAPDGFSLESFELAGEHPIMSERRTSALALLGMLALGFALGWIVHTGPRRTAGDLSAVRSIVVTQPTREVFPSQVETHLRVDRITNANGEIIADGHGTQASDGSPRVWRLVVEGYTIYATPE
jgi:hypothetical protein